MAARTSRASEAIAPGDTFAHGHDKISAIVLKRPPVAGWLFGFAHFVLALLMVLNLAIGCLFLKGVGIWGINIPVGWASTSSTSSGGSASATPAR